MVRYVVSSEKSNNSEKIKFFKIGDRGDIESAMPSSSNNNEKKQNETITNIKFDDKAKDNSTDANIENSDSFDKTKSDSIEKQLSELKPHIENISNKDDSLSDDQIEILKKYVTLKEAEVRDLLEQKRQYQTLLKKVSSELEEVSEIRAHLTIELENERKKNETLISENHRIIEKHKDEIRLLKNEYEEKIRLIDHASLEMSQLGQEKEAWKAQIREELKKIRLKERELENKYELLKRDSAALLDSKDKHIMDLKRKNDALELEMESLEEKLRNYNIVLNNLGAKKEKLIETFKLAISLIEEIDKAEPSSDKKVSNY